MDQYNNFRKLHDVGIFLIGVSALILAIHFVFKESLEEKAMNHYLKMSSSYLNDTPDSVDDENDVPASINGEE